VQVLAAPDRTNWNANTSTALLLLIVGVVLLLAMLGRVRHRPKGRRMFTAVVAATIGLTVIGALGYHAVGLHGFAA
jgi:CHASE2 domain-containing sensor protein